MAWVSVQLCKLQKMCTRLAVTSDKVYQLLAHGLWFSLGTPTSSTTKTGRHDIAVILLKVALKHQKPKIKYSNISYKIMYKCSFTLCILCSLWHAIIYPVVRCDLFILFFLVQYNTITVATNYETNVKNITKIQYIDNFHA